MAWIIYWTDKKGTNHTKEVPRESAASMWVSRYREKGYRNVSKHEAKYPSRGSKSERTGRG